MGAADIIKKPLRRVYWWLHSRESARLERRWYRERRREIAAPPGKKVYILGTPSHENLGDSAIVLAQMAFLKSCGWEESRIKEITDLDCERFWKDLPELIPEDALIAHLGGGHMGNQWPAEEEFHRQQLGMFPKNPSVIFPQTLYYLPDEAGREAAQASVVVYNGRENLTLTARERYSYEAMGQLYPDTKILLTPDIVLSANMSVFGAKPQKREGILLCLRSDSERVLGGEAHDALRSAAEATGLGVSTTDMYSRQRVTAETRKELVREKMEELAGARLVITDRLHGMVFCALTGTPCIVFSNNNPKVRGTYEWISYLPYIRYAESVEAVKPLLEELLAMESCSFDNSPLLRHYEQLAEVVRKYAPN